MSDSDLLVVRCTLHLVLCTLYFALCFLCFVRWILPGTLSFVHFAKACWSVSPMLTA
jgi:hypothetical protein